MITNEYLFDDIKLEELIAMNEEWGFTFDINDGKIVHVNVE